MPVDFSYRGLASAARGGGSHRAARPTPQSAFGESMAAAIGPGAQAAATRMNEAYTTGAFGLAQQGIAAQGQVSSQGMNALGGIAQQAVASRSSEKLADMALKNAREKRGWQVAALAAGTGTALYKGHQMSQALSKIQLPELQLNTSPPQPRALPSLGGGITAGGNAAGGNAAGGTDGNEAGQQAATGFAVDFGKRFDVDAFGASLQQYPNAFGPGALGSGSPGFAAASSFKTPQGLGLSIQPPALAAKVDYQGTNGLVAFNAPANIQAPQPSQQVVPAAEGADGAVAIQRARRQNQSLF